VVDFESVCVPSELVLFWVRVVLRVPIGGATTDGMTVVVVCDDDDDDCAMAAPVIITSAAAPANNNLLILYSPITGRRGGLPRVVLVR